MKLLRFLQHSANGFAQRGGISTLMQRDFAHVTKLQVTNDAVTTLEIWVNGQQNFLNISPRCAVVLASGTIEATRLAMESFPTPLMGRNLMGHLRSNTVVRIHRSALDPALPKQLEAAALLVRDSNGKGRYHLQVTAAAVAGANSEATMWRAEILRAADPSRLQRATLSRCFNLL